MTTALSYEGDVIDTVTTFSEDTLKTDPFTKLHPSPEQRSPGMWVSWEDRIEMLKRYKAEHGNLLIPIRYKCNPSLGKFVHNTREQFKLFHHKTKAGYKKKCSLTEERIKQLDELGFVWSTERTKRQNDNWESRFEQLKQYKAQHGHCQVPHGYAEDPVSHSCTFCWCDLLEEDLRCCVESVLLLSEPKE